MNQKNKTDVNAMLSLVNQRLLGIKGSTAQRVALSPILYMFGSTAVGLNTVNSDIDLLATSELKFHTQENGLDIVSITPETLTNEDWLHSELGTHIAKYGVQLWGEPGLIRGSVPNGKAVSAKERRIESYLNALGVRWNNFDLPMKENYIEKISLDLLRLGLLRSEIAVPPTILLPDLGRLNGVDPLEVLRTINGSLSRAFLNELIEHISSYSHTANSV